MPPQQPWTAAEADGDAVSKKDLVNFLHAHATYAFLKSNKLYGKAANVSKTAKKPDLVKAYQALFDTDAFRPDGVTLEEQAEQAKQAEAAEQKEKTEAVEEKKEVLNETPKFTKQVLKKGGSDRKPKKGETVSVLYTGYLPDGSIFDTNLTGKKKPVALRFKVGTGRVIRGWDEGLLTMCNGEKARLKIESEWAYGKKGVEGKIPPNTELTFEVELIGID
ncbi:FK506-binding protein 2B [Gaertneriomyces sp. JEL0708]|nr:FK506-binding protein 2B [Gaertneriomyces sp. JEL0708]